MKFTESATKQSTEEVIKQLQAALEASRLYADKLVEGIPYLPADLKNSQQTVLQLTVENDGLRKDLEELTRKYNNLAAATKDIYSPPVKHPEVAELQDRFGMKNYYEGPSITEAMTESMKNNPIKVVASAEEMMQNATMAASDDVEDLKQQIKALEREISSYKKIVKFECVDWAEADTLLEKLGCVMFEADYHLTLEDGIQQLNDRWAAAAEEKNKLIRDQNDKIMSIFPALRNAVAVMKEMSDIQEFPGPYSVNAKPVGNGKWNVVDKHGTILMSGYTASHLQAACDCMNAVADAAPHVISSVASDEQSARTLIGAVVGQATNKQIPAGGVKQSATDNQPREF